MSYRHTRDSRLGMRGGLASLPIPHAQMVKIVLSHIARFVSHPNQAGSELADDLPEVGLCGDDVFNTLVCLRCLVESAAQQGDPTVAQILVARGLAHPVQSGAA